MNNFDYMRSALGIVGSALIWAFGKWDLAVQTLVVFMIIDWVTGFMVAAFWHKSNKTGSGALSSSVGFKGLCRKIVVLFMVLISNLLDRVTGTNFIRDAVVIAYIVNETVSILENVGTMGVPIPRIVTKTIDALKQKEEAEK